MREAAEAARAEAQGWVLRSPMRPTLCQQRLGPQGGDMRLLATQGPRGARSSPQAWIGRCEQDEWAVWGRADAPLDDCGKRVQPAGCHCGLSVGLRGGDGYEIDRDNAVAGRFAECCPGFKSLYSARVAGPEQTDFDNEVIQNLSWIKLCLFSEQTLCKPC